MTCQWAVLGGQQQRHGQRGQFTVGWNHRPPLLGGSDSGIVTVHHLSTLNPVSAFPAANTPPAWQWPSHVTRSHPGTQPRCSHLHRPRDKRADSRSGAGTAGSSSGRAGRRPQSPLGLRAAGPGSGGSAHPRCSWGEAAGVAAQRGAAPRQGTSECGRNEASKSEQMAEGHRGALFSWTLGQQPSSAGAAQ